MKTKGNILKMAEKLKCLSVTTIVTLSFCLNAFAQEAKGKDWTEEEWKKEKGSYGWVFPHIDKDADGTVTLFCVTGD